MNVTHLNALCYTYECYTWMLHIWMHYTYKCVMLHLMLYHNAFIWMLHIWMRYLTSHVVSQRIHKCNAFICVMLYVTFYHIQKVPRSAFGHTPRHMCAHDSFKIQRQIRVLPLNVSCYTYGCVVSHSESTEICVNMTHSKFSARSAYYPSTCHVTHTNALYHIQKVPRSAFGPSKIDVWTSRCVNMIHPKESSTLNRIHPSGEFWKSHVHTCVLECVLIHPKESSTWGFWDPDSTSAKSIARDALQQNY